MDPDEPDCVDAEDDEGVGETTGAGVKLDPDDELDELELLLLLLLLVGFGVDCCLTAAGAGSGLGGAAGSGLCAAAVPALPSRASVAKRARVILRSDGNRVSLGRWRIPD